jgi:hypothetical protein
MKLKTIKITKEKSKIMKTFTTSQTVAPTLDPIGDWNN